MPNIPGVVETFEKVTKLHELKNADYSGSKGSFFNFEFCDILSSLFANSRDKVYAVFVGVKLARLSVILTSKKINNESIEDSFDDLITYAAIWKSDVMQRNHDNR